MTPPPDRLAAALGNTYRLERELGQGGMATVYLAHDLKHDRKVAIKVLKPELAAVIGAERFVVEIKTTASLQHPHILPLFDSGAADSFLYYVMPYIEGETLRTRLDRETQLGVDDAVRIAASVADALDYAHRRGVVHRDIKPENILLHEGRPMVVDFGIALALSAAAGGRMTETGLSLGTPHYMSPEQATAEKEITARSDVYSLGTVLFEMLAGQPPHLGGSAQQIIMKIITEEATPVTTLRKSVPPNVAAAVAKSLEKLPADRFESAKAFADALGNPSFTTIGLAAPGQTAGGRGPGVSRRLFGVTAVVAATALVAAALGWFRPVPQAPVNRFMLALPDSQSIAAEPVNRLAISPDGRTIVYAGGTVGQSRLLLRRLDDLRATPIPGTEGAFNPAFSPDGERLAFVAGSPRALKTVALRGGPAVTLTDSLVDNGGVTWADDGYLYYDGHLSGDGLARVRETGGPPEIATTPDSTTESWHASPAALPDGRGVLFVVSRLRGAGDSDIGVIAPGATRHKILVRGVRATYVRSGHLLYVTAEGTLMAAPFDLKRLELTGAAVPLAESVAIRGISRVDIAASRTGTLVYVAGSARARIRELVWVTRDGTAMPVDSSWSVPITGRPALSPDGRSALVTIRGKTWPGVWVKQLDRGPASKLIDGDRATWFPNGREFAYATRLGFGRGPADGSTLPREFKGTGPLLSPDVSPDGQWILGSYAADIYLARAGGDSAPRLLLGGPAAETRAVFSPDGRWIAYVSDESGATEIYVRPFPDVQAAKRPVSAKGGVAPRWSHDGRELFFVDGQGEMVSVPVRLTPTFSAGTPVRLFSGEPFGFPTWGFDVTADGQRFLATRPAGGKAVTGDAIVIVENLFTELTAKVRGKN